MKTMKKPGATLFALTASALSLPIYSNVHAAPAEGMQVDYRYSHYREDDLPADKAANGLEQERYAVDSHQFNFVLPVTERLGLSADAVYETMSGASPWFNTPDASGKAVQVMSGATIEDQRVAVDVHAHLAQDNTKETFTLGVNHERDYLSLSGGVEGQLDFDEQRRTFTAGIGYSHDQLKPTEGGTTKFASRIAEANKNTVNVLLGYSQVLTEQTVAQIAFNYGLSNGYLSDPYKMAYVAGALLQDNRPDQRSTFAINARLRQYFPAVSAALHVDYHNFADSWGIVSNSLDVSWQQKLPDDWKLVPGVRYYDQGRANFYSPYYAAARSDGYYSSDYRLSPYGALSYRLGVNKAWQGWTFAVNGEMYRSKASYALKQVGPNQESPGLVNFTMLSVSAGYRF